MSIPSSLTPLFSTGSSAAAGYQVSRSLRFNSADSAFLSRTPAVAGDRKKWTWAGWVKRGAISGEVPLFHTPGNSNDSAYLRIYINSDQLSVTTFNASGGIAIGVTTTQVFRDPSSWMHFVVALDTTQATASDRLKIYVNGSQVTQFSSSNWPTQNTDYGINTSGLIHYIGLRTDGTNYADGYLADIHFIDGQALTPSSFTEVSATTGQLVPIAYTGGSYGTNGFYLQFADNSSNTAATLGKDTSPNGNNWTPNNFSVTDGNGNYVSGVSGAQTTGEVAANLFDGNTGTYCSAATNGGTVTVTFTPSRSVTSSTRIFNGSSTLNVAVNGGSAVNYTGTGWKNLGFTGTLTSISFTHGGGGIGSMNAIELDGIVLLDNAVVGKNVDSLVDTPTSISATDTGVGGEIRGNYATWNPLQSSAATLTNGNLDCTTVTATGGQVRATIAVSSGKWYWEVTVNTTVTANNIGIIKTSEALAADRPNYFAGGYAYVGSSGDKENNASASAYGATYGSGDVIGVALDLDAGTLVFYKNGASQGTAFSSLTGEFIPCVGDGTGSDGLDMTTNFGQRAFVYTAPSGFKALCDTNLGAPLVAKPNELMDVALFTGNGSSQNVTGLNFAPDFVWAKRRSAADSHLLFDAIRGATVFLGSDTTNGDQTLSSGLTAFNSDGFSWGSYGNGATFVAWAWDAGSTPVAKVYGAAATVSSTAPLATTFISNASPSTVPNSYQNYDLDLGRSVTTIDIKFTYTANTISYLVSSDGTNWTSLSTGNSQTAGATVTISDTSAFRYLRFHYPPGNFNQGFQEINNTQGSITSQVRANVSAGFSVVTYTGNGTGGATFGHGLGVKPGFSICKKRTGSPDGWYILHSSLGATKYIMLNSTNGSATYSGLWNDTEPTSTLFTVGVDYAANQNGVDYISYQFAPVVGYSSMGSYTGNGGSSNFVYTGFRPRFILIKRTDATAADGSWFLFDTARDAYNVGGAQLLADKADQEPAFYGYLDYLSNGFNIQSGSTLNGSTRQYVYAAFAENPFQYARAR